MTADIARAERLLPAAFPSVARRVLRASLIFGPLLIWLIALCAWFDITPIRLLNGIGGVTTILRQMVPPSPGAQWQDILLGLAQSVAMLFSERSSPRCLPCLWGCWVRATSW